MLKIRFIKIISEIVYRARILFIGAVTKKPIDRLINKIYDAEDYSFWDSILAYAYRRELNAYVLAADVNVLKQSDDVFINNPIIMQYEREFIELANKYTFKMKGMINSSLLILYCMIRHTKPEIFIESGLGNGYSSGYIAEALRMNNNGAKMYCLSFFSPEEYENVTNTLKPFDFVQIIEGRSEITIDSLSEQCKDNTIGVLVGGPMARVMDWNVLIDKLIKQFPKLLFLTVASAQEHVPFWSDGGIQYTPRHINIERLKLVNIYSNHYKNKGYSLYIQSNQFSRKYQYLDALVYEYRNQRWGREFPFGPYKVDKMNDHIAYSIKLGMIYKNHLL